MIPRPSRRILQFSERSTPTYSAQKGYKYFECKRKISSQWFNSSSKQTFFDAPLGLLHELPDEDHNGGAAISARVVQRQCHPRDHDSGFAVDKLAAWNLSQRPEERASSQRVLLLGPRSIVYLVPFVSRGCSHPWWAWYHQLHPQACKSKRNLRYTSTHYYCLYAWNLSI